MNSYSQSKKYFLPVFFIQLCNCKIWLNVEYWRRKDSYCTGFYFQLYFQLRNLEKEVLWSFFFIESSLQQVQCTFYIVETNVTIWIKSNHSTMVLGILKDTLIDGAEEISIPSRWNPGWLSFDGSRFTSVFLYEIMILFNNVFSIWLFSYCLQNVFFLLLNNSMIIKRNLILWKIGNSTLNETKIQFI